MSQQDMLRRIQPKSLMLQLPSSVTTKITNNIINFIHCDFSNELERLSYPPKQIQPQTLYKFWKQFVLIFLSFSFFYKPILTDQLFSATKKCFTIRYHIWPFVWPISWSSQHWTYNVHFFLIRALNENSPEIQSIYRLDFQQSSFDEI